MFADGTESIFLADMSGDGLTDLVRVRNGEVCYWPNLGYGRFGAKVTMDNAPVRPSGPLRRPPRPAGGHRRLRHRRHHLFRRQLASTCTSTSRATAGATRRVLSHFPAVDNAHRPPSLDLLGNGTACLVWSSPLPGDARRPMRYIDLMGGQKPHLLVRVATTWAPRRVVTTRRRPNSTCRTSSRARPG